MAKAIYPERNAPNRMRLLVNGKDYWWVNTSPLNALNIFNNRSAWCSLHINFLSIYWPSFVWIFIIIHLDDIQEHSIYIYHQRIGEHENLLSIFFFSVSICKWTVQLLHRMYKCIDKFFHVTLIKIRNSNNVDSAFIWWIRFHLYSY